MAKLKSYLYKVEPQPSELGKVAIYALVKSKTQEIFYVGMTRSPDIRRSIHDRFDRTVDDMYVIEIVDEADADEAENRWIDYYRGRGAKLENVLVGGKRLDAGKHQRHRGVYKYTIEQMNKIAAIYGGRCLSNKYEGGSF